MAADDKAHIRGELDLSGAEWRRGRGSDPDLGHVEIAFVEGYIAMRNSADAPDDPVLIFTPAEWEAFVLGAKDGEFDAP